MVPITGLIGSNLSLAGGWLHLSIDVGALVFERSFFNGRKHIHSWIAKNFTGDDAQKALRKEYGFACRQIGPPALVVDRDELVPLLRAACPLMDRRA